MDFLNTEVEKEYLRWTGLVGGNDPYTSKETVGLHQVLKAHFLIVDFFAQEGGGVGGIGPKSVDLLHSAIYRQFVSYGGKIMNDGVRSCLLRQEARPDPGHVMTPTT